MLDKWMSTVGSRKFIALMLAGLLPILNRVLGVNLDYEVMLPIVLALAAWAGIEGALDLTKGRTSSPDMTKLLTLFEEAMKVAINGEPVKPATPDEPVIPSFDVKKEPRP